VAELREEVTWVWAATIMVEVCAAQADRMAQEMAVLLACTREEAHEVARRVSFIEGELAGACQARDTTKEKLPSLVDRSTTVDQRRVASEE
jgi:hypothetical protein